MAVKSKKTYKKRKASVKKAVKDFNKKVFKSKVLKIVRGTEETKSVITNQTYILPAVVNGLTTYNLASYLPQNATEGGMIGKKVYVTGIKINFGWDTTTQYFDGQATVTGALSTPTRIRFGVLAHKKYAVIASLTNDDINDNRYGNMNVYRPHYDTDKCRMIKYHTFQNKPIMSGVSNSSLSRPTGTGNVTTGNDAIPQYYSKTMWIPIKKHWIFKERAVDYELAGMNYYFFIQQSDINNIGTPHNNYGTIGFDVTVFYKDA